MSALPNQVNVRAVWPRDDSAAPLEASKAAQEVLGRKLSSHLLTAGPIQWNQ